MGLQTAAYGSQVATISTEHSLTQRTEVGIFILLVDTTEMQAGDTLELRIKTKRLITDSSITAYKYSFNDVQTEPHKYSVPVPSDVEIICTLTQTTGTGRTFLWKLLRA
jgi:hypothetical protein